MESSNKKILLGILLAFSLSFASLIFLLRGVGLKTQENLVHRYVITETKMLDSLDPLDADSSQNLPVAQMVYSTPLEVSHQNTLTSRVLESFSYDESLYLIRWRVRESIYFEDGSQITADDVAFSILRMLFARPKFPVLSKIAGVDEWLNRKEPLKSYPAGIKVKGRTIEIQLVGETRHPLFRFCLELFSIIPRKCVDPKTNSVICSEIPSSGKYRIAQLSNEKISFSHSAFLNGEEKKLLPRNISFEYRSSTELLQKTAPWMDSSVVVAGSEVHFTPRELKLLSKSYNFSYLPSSRFMSILLNPGVYPFDDQKCRQLFAMEFREQYRNHVGGVLKMEDSLFSQILPGYHQPGSLRSRLSKSEIQLCKEKLSSARLRWGVSANPLGELSNELIIRSLKRLGAKNYGGNIRKPSESLANFMKNSSFAIFFGSGFWAQDPLGDIKMLFTPGLHKGLDFISNDPEIQRHLKGIEETDESLSFFNRLIFEKAKLNVFTHPRRFFLYSKDKKLRYLPVAITSPAPWQLFL